MDLKVFFNVEKNIIMAEFTVQKNIKGTECACSCFCALPDSPEALNQLEGKNPEDVAHQSFSPEMSRSKFEIKNKWKWFFRI